MRRTVNGILRQAKPPKPNTTKDMQVARKNLKQDDTITILPADKGRASVVLDTNIYHNKMKTLIETGPYRLLNKDRTERLSRKLTDKTGTYGLLLLRPLRFRSTLTKRGIFLFGERLSLLIVTPTGTHVGSKRLSISDFIPTTSIEIAESTSSKLGYPRSNNTTADL